MRLAAYSLVAFLTIAICVSAAHAQQRRYSPPRPRTPAPRPQTQQPVPQVANRPSRAPKPDEVVKQEIVSTIMSQIVMGGLHKPTALAVQPKSGALYVAEGDTGLVGKLNDVPGSYRLDPTIENLGADASATPIAISFVEKYTLLVGLGGKENGGPALRTYKILPAGSIDAANSDAPVQLPSGDAIGRFNIMTTGATTFITAQGANGGWVARTDEQNHELTQLMAVEGLGTIKSPSAVAVGRNAELVVAQMGSPTTPADSSVTVFDLKANRRIAQVATGLHDIVGLAISPKTNRVYAVDFSSVAPEQGGLYRLDLIDDEGETVCKATRLMPLDRPSALAFTPDGTLFVATWGSLSADYQDGLLVRIYNDSNL